MKCWICSGTGEDADTDGAGNWTRVPCAGCDGTGVEPARWPVRLFRALRDFLNPDVPSFDPHGWTDPAIEARASQPERTESE